MVYILPRKVKCPKCDFEFAYTPHDGLLAVDGKPVCPQCYGRWIKKNLPLCEYVVTDA